MGFLHPLIGHRRFIFSTLSAKAMPSIDPKAVLAAKGKVEISRTGRSFNRVCDPDVRKTS
jgi:hypothetical protein